MAAGTGSAGREHLSLATLVIAALAAAGAAVLVSQFSESGSAMAAALTAVFIPLLREAFHRPARAISDVRSGRRTGSSLAATAGAGGATAGDDRRAEPETRRTDLAWSGREGSAASPADPETRRLEADERANGPRPGLPGRDAEEGEGEPSLFGGEDVPVDMLEREGGPPEGAPTGGAETRRLDADGAPADAETRRLDPEGPPAELETRGLEGETVPLEADTRAPAEGGGGRAGGPVGGAGARARAPARGPGSNGAAAGRRPGPTAAGARRVLGGRRPRVRIAVLTGLLAFVIAAVVLTVPELITGGSIGGGEGRTTLFSSGGGPGDSGSDDAIEDGAIDGDGGSSPDAGDGGGSSDPVPGGASEDGGDAGGGSGEGGSSAPGDGSTPAPDGSGAQKRGGGGGSVPAPQSAPSGGGTGAGTGAPSP